MTTFAEQSMCFEHSRTFDGSGYHFQPTYSESNMSYVIGSHFDALKFKRKSSFIYHGLENDCKFS